jgi:hypothetical protein
VPQTVAWKRREMHFSGNTDSVSKAEVRIEEKQKKESV